MPDWSYHPLKKMLLDKINPATSREFIHRSMNTIAAFPGGRNLIGFLGHMTPSPRLQQEFASLTFPAPIGLSGIIDPKLSGTNAFQELGFGFIEIGPIVLNEPSVQNPPIREIKHLLFSEHPEVLPLKRAIKVLLNFNPKVPILARIDDHVSQKEWNVIVQQLTPFVDAFIGTKDQIKEWGSSSKQFPRPFYIALSPDEENDLSEFIQDDSFAGIILHAPRQHRNNYWCEYEDANKKLISTVKQMKELHPELLVITSGGVETPEEACALINAGANLIMLTEGYINAGPGLPKRINELLLFEREPSPAKQNGYWSLLFGLTILLGGFIALYFAFTSIILPYDESFIGLTKDEIAIVNPLILLFMSHDRMALAGTMISGGILYIQLARHGIKNGLHWSKVAFHSAAIIGFIGIFLFIGFGYFDWLHGLFWLILLPIYYFSFKEGKGALNSPVSNHRKNDRAWQYGLYGQLMFVILGFLLCIGGLVIATIGVSKVFVATDLSFLCMTPQMLDSISQNLIPVIAHDRAGFGGALVSVGLLVLMISLWGFRQGERWVWNTLALGALPAFIAGIGTHLYIGYTDFIHLLPVYFLVILYVAGLALSYPFLNRK